MTTELSKKLGIEPTVQVLVICPNHGSMGIMPVNKVQEALKSHEAEFMCVSLVDIRVVPQMIIDKNH